jgi:hypothetical protein
MEHDIGGAWRPYPQFTLYPHDGILEVHDYGWHVLILLLPWGAVARLLQPVVLERHLKADCRAREAKLANSGCGPLSFPRASASIK